MNAALKQQAYNNMAIGYILDKGIDFTSKITDSEIQELEGNDFMSTEFMQGLVEYARDLAKGSLDDIVVNIQNNFYIHGNMNVVNAKKYLYNAIVCLEEENYSKDELLDMLGMDEEEYDEVMEEE